MLHSKASAGVAPAREMRARSISGRSRSGALRATPIVFSEERRETISSRRLRPLLRDHRLQELSESAKGWKAKSERDRADRPDCFLPEAATAVFCFCRRRE